MVEAVTAPINAATTSLLELIDLSTKWFHAGEVQPNINLEEENYRFVKKQAINEGCSIDSVINKILKEVINRCSEESRTTRNQFPVSKGLRSFTSEVVDAIE
jgi:hypothetical protein